MTEPRDELERWSELVDRRALGEQLGAEDDAFSVRYAEAHPECARELELYAELADLSVTPNEGSRALVDRALKRMEADEAARAVAEVDTFRQRKVPVLRVVVSGLAVAAAVVFFLRESARRDDGELRASAQASIPSRAELVYASGSVNVSGQAASVGHTLLSEGNVIETGEGTACVLIDPEINVCLSTHTRLRLSALRTPARRLELEAGKAATRLAAQPEGMSLSISVGDVLSTAVGTAFSVERADDGVVTTVVTTVLNGKVRVGRKNDAQIVAAHQRAAVSTRAASAGARPGVTSVSRSEEAPSWAMLGPTVLWHDPVAAAIDVRGQPERAEAWLDDQLIGMAPLSSLVPVGSHHLIVRSGGQVLLDRELHMNAGETQAVAYLPLLTAATPPVVAAAPKPLAHELKTGELALDAKALTARELGLREPSPTAAASESPASLLAGARRALREGRYAEAEKSYEAIGSAYPQSEEAHTVLVSLAQLELTQLGQPERALTRLDAYLAAGGALSEEARVARIHALRSLHRDADEALAIAEFLTKHPHSFQAADLRARLATLEAAR